MTVDPEIAALGDPRPLRREDVASAARTIARAFSWHEPWGAWVLPKEETRESILTDLVKNDLEQRFLEAGRCSTIGGASVTLWIPPSSEVGAEVFGARRSEEEYRAFGEQAGALRQGDALLQSLEPEGDCWYLDTIATDPGYMFRGLGSRLLAHDLTEMEAKGRRCALDTHTPENVGFYRGHGFELVAESKLPSGGPDLYVMVREPH